MLVVILALVVMITLHELGHYLTAKRAGMKVTEFFLGFGPKIWSIQRGETEYGIKLHPGRRLREDHRHGEPRGGAAGGRGPHLPPEVVRPAGVGGRRRLGHALPAGPGADLRGPGRSSGSPAARSTTEPGSPAPVDRAASPTGSGADEAGLQPGDRIVAIDGEPTTAAPAKRRSRQVVPVPTRTATTVPRSPTLLQRSSTARPAVGLAAAAYTYTADRRQPPTRGLRPRHHRWHERRPTEKVGPVEGLVQGAGRVRNIIVGVSIEGRSASFFSPSGISPTSARQVGSAREDRTTPGQDVRRPRTRTRARRRPPRSTARLAPRLAPRARTGSCRSTASSARLRRRRRSTPAR